MSPFITDKIVSPAIILEYSSRSYWIKVKDDHDMEYFPGEEGGLSGFINREIWQYSTKDVKEALIVFHTLRKFMDRLYADDIHIVTFEEDVEEVK